jgi:hypothetical protein
MAMIDDGDDEMRLHPFFLNNESSHVFFKTSRWTQNLSSSRRQ